MRGVSGFRYACPSGETSEPRPGLCVGSRTTPTESRQEPFVAAHPRLPDVFALGVNYGVWSDPAWSTGESAEPVPLEVSITEDAGATWRSSFPPTVPDQRGGQGDPTLVFDGDGTLHFSAMAGQKIFYARSTDLGTTWSPPTVLEPQDVGDRNWLTVHGRTVFVSWQRPAETRSLVAWSTDAGLTWQTTPPQALPCLTVSAALPTDDAALFACSESANGGTIYLFELALGNGSLTKLDDLPLRGVHPMLSRQADGTIVASSKVGDEDADLALGSPDGRLWTKGPSLRSLLGTDDPWASFNRHWMVADLWGGVHFIVTGHRLSAGPGSGFSSLLVGRTQESRVTHAVLTMGLDSVIQETPLVEGDVVNPRRTPPNAGPPTIGDHYHGIGFGAHSGWMAWTWDRGIEFTRLEPMFE